MKIHCILMVLSLSFFGCKSSKLEKDLPFVIKKATYNHWVGGQPGARGINITFEIDKLDKKIVVERVYFKDHMEKLYLRSSNPYSIFTANISTADPEKNPDIIMHKDPKKEYGNTLPKKVVQPPFEIKDDEAILVYTEDSKERFYKVILKREKDIFYP